MSTHRFLALMIVFVCVSIVLELARGALRAAPASAPRVAHARVAGVVRVLWSIAIACFACFLGAVACGCTSMATVREDRARGEGVARDYAATDAHAWDASREVLREEGAATVEEDRSSGCLWAHFEAKGIATSTNVGVCLSPLEDGRTRVVCISRRHRQLTIATRLSEDGFHAALAAKLGATVVK